MKIKTLEYIHQLLKEAEAKTSADCEEAQRLQDEYMEKGMEAELIKLREETIDQTNGENSRGCLRSQRF